MFSVEDNGLREVGLQGNSSGMRGFWENTGDSRWSQGSGNEGIWTCIYKVAGGLDVVGWRLWMDFWGVEDEDAGASMMSTAFVMITPRLWVDKTPKGRL